MSDTKCPCCGAHEDDLSTWAADGESAEADHAECSLCGHQWDLKDDN
jgi:Zn ribbon nucleic-acid-binding protein